METVVSGIGFVSLCAAYGVQLERHEGRAGMVAVKLRDGAKFEGDMFFDSVKAHLMPAGRPRFVRVVDKLEVTSSLKIIKYRLQREGIEPEHCKDVIYWYNEAEQTYTRLTENMYPRVCATL